MAKFTIQKSSRYIFPVNDNFFYDNMELQIVDSYVYLGMLLQYNGKFLQTEKRLSQQGARALSSLINSLYYFNIMSTMKTPYF
jgi:hypothetical protein